MEIINNLLKNSIGFFKKSFDDFNAKHIKFSLLNHFNGLELLLKAGLCEINFLLIIDKKNFSKKKQKENLSDAEIIKGDFMTIAFREVLKRIHDLKLIQEDEKEVFEKIYDKRNKLIHFYDLSIDDDNEKVVILNLLAKSYFAINIFVMNKKFHNFDPFAKDFKFLEHILKDSKEYIDVVFQNKIHSLEFSSISNYILDCPECNKRSLLVNKNLHSVNSGECQVCNTESICIRYYCKKCNHLNLLTHGDGECIKSYCNEPFSKENILYLLQPLKEGAYGDCLHCGQSKVVGRYNKVLICAECFDYQKLHN